MSVLNVQDFPTDPTQAVNPFAGDTGSGGVKGAVPAPPAGSAAAGDFLRADGTWAAPTGGLPTTPESANTVLAGPTSGAAAAPAFRGLVAGDIPGTLNPTTVDASGGKAATALTIKQDNGNTSLLLTDGTGQWGQRIDNSPFGSHLLAFNDGSTDVVWLESSTTGNRTLVCEANPNSGIALTLWYSAVPQTWDLLIFNKQLIFTDATANKIMLTVHPASDAVALDIAGLATATTPAAGDDSTNVATTAFVQNLVAGTFTALARTGWVATAMEQYGSQQPSFSLDGDTTTFWLSNGTLPVWLQLDMQSPQTFNAVEVLFRQDGYIDFPGSVQLFTSDDATTWTQVWSQTGISCTSLLIFGPFASSVTHRYLRYQVNTSCPGGRVYQSVAEINVGTWQPGLMNQIGPKLANTVFAGPTSGSAATPTFRALIAADIPSSSDERLKTVEKPYEGGLEALLKVTPVYYRWNEEGTKHIGLSGDRTHLGFIAQDVQKAIPECITGTEGEKQYLSFDDKPIVAALVDAIKTLEKRVRELEAK